MRQRRKKIEETSEGAPEWMGTYSDLVTLLLVFFIMLFSMASVDKEKFQNVADSLRNQFLHISSGEVIGGETGKAVIGLENNNILPQEDNAAKIRKMEEDLEATIKELGLDEHVSVINDEHTITLRINSAILFDSGYADIKASGKDVLLKLGKFFQNIPNKVIVQGHTDNVPINTPLFPTNWELSTKRATNVVIYLVDECGLEPIRMTATGNGEFQPIKPNNSEENRQQNRRIDILIEK
jgi:chemotaxis protein MotB